MRAVAVRRIPNGRSIGVDFGRGILPSVCIARRRVEGRLLLVPDGKQAGCAVRVLEVEMLVVDPVVDVAHDDAGSGLSAEIGRAGSPVVGLGLGRRGRVVQVLVDHVDGADARHSRQRSDLLVHGKRHLGRHYPIGEAGPDDHAQGLQIRLIGGPFQPQTHVSLAVDFPGRRQGVLANAGEGLVRAHHRSDRPQIRGGK